MSNHHAAKLAEAGSGAPGGAYARMAASQPDLERPLIIHEDMSPVHQWRLWTGLKPYDWQFALWKACFQDGVMVAMRTANGTGKTGVAIPVLAFSWAAAFPGGQVVITSASERQLQKQLEPSLRSMIAPHKKWRYKQGTITAPSVDGVLEPSTITWFSTKQGELFEGFHNRYYPDKKGRMRYSPLLIIIDEAKSVSHDIFVAVERCDPVSQLVISTTGEDTGDFHDACMNRTGTWITSGKWQGKKIPFVVPWTMCEHLMHGASYKRKQAMLSAAGGKKTPEICSILLAEFFRSGTHMLFDDSDLSATLDCMSGLHQRIQGTRRAFCDFAAGGDELVFGLREGNYVHPLVAWRCDKDTPPSKIAGDFVTLFKSHGLRDEEIYADNGGMGQVLISAFQDLGYSLNRVNRNFSAINQAAFSDRYAELHIDLKRRIHDKSIILPRDEVLLEQMRRRQYVRRNQDENRLRIEPKEEARKKRQENSPDRLDVVAYLMDGMEHYEAPAKRILNTVCGSPKEYMAAMRRRTEDELACGEDDSVWPSGMGMEE